MAYNQILIDKRLKLHKQIAYKLGRMPFILHADIPDIIHQEISFYIKIGEELALITQNYQCQNCDTRTDLQLHHLIQRMNRGYFPIIRYITQRHYFASIIVLCRPCHAQLENRTLDMLDLPAVIPTEKINKLKQRYGEK